MELSKDILGMWLSSPKFWEGKKLCHFLVQVHNNLKDKPKSDFENVLDDPQMIAKWNLWNGQGSWEEVLGAIHFPFVTKYVANTKNSKKLTKYSGNTSSVLELLRLIRNKHQHNDELVAANSQLLWFRVKGTELVFDDELYGSYWNSKFPNLGLYLWTQIIKCKNIKETLSSYYPDRLITMIQSIRPENMWSDLERGFCNQKNEGFLIARYEKPCEKVKLEFRHIPKELTHRVLNESSTFIITSQKGHTFCKWYNKSGEVESTSSVSYMNSTNIIIAKTIFDINVELLKEVFKFPNSTFYILFSHDIHPVQK